MLSQRIWFDFNLIIACSLLLFVFHNTVPIPYWTQVLRTHTHYAHTHTHTHTHTHMRLYKAQSVDFSSRPWNWLSPCIRIILLYTSSKKLALSKKKSVCDENLGIFLIDNLSIILLKNLKLAFCKPRYYAKKIQC